MPTLTLKCPEELMAQLAEEAKMQNIAKSDLVRRAIQYYLQYEGVSQSKKSIYERSKDLCGSVEGASDLSTNPEHLKGFGE